MDQEDFYKTALIAALQALIHNNPGISAKYAAKKAKEYAMELETLHYGEYNNPFPDKVV